MIIVCVSEQFFLHIIPSANKYTTSNASLWCVYFVVFPIPTCTTIVHGKTVQEHGARLTNLLRRIEDLGSTLNRDKCVFHMTELVFMGHLLSAWGIGLESEKVRAVKKLDDQRVRLKFWFIELYQ